MSVINIVGEPMCLLHISFNFSMGLKNYKTFKKELYNEFFTIIFLKNFINFIFGCVGSSLLSMGFL